MACSAVGCTFLVVSRDRRRHEIKYVNVARERVGETFMVVIKMKIFGSTRRRKGKHEKGLKDT